MISLVRFGHLTVYQSPKNTFPKKIASVFKLLISLVKFGQNQPIRILANKPKVISRQHYSILDPGKRPGRTCHSWSEACNTELSVQNFWSRESFLTASYTLAILKTTLIQKIEHFSKCIKILIGVYFPELNEPENFCKFLRMMFLYSKFI